MYPILFNYIFVYLKLISKVLLSNIQVILQIYCFKIIFHGSIKKKNGNYVLDSLFK